MADPLTIITGTVTLAEASFRTGKYLRQIQKTSRNIGPEIQLLENELVKLNAFYSALRQVYQRHVAQQQQTQRMLPSATDDACKILWTQAADLVQQGRSVEIRLEKLAAGIVGARAGKRLQALDDVKRSIKIQSRREEFGNIRQGLMSINGQLNTTLTAIDVTSNALYYGNIHNSISTFSNDLRSLKAELNSRIDALQTSSSAASLPPRAASQHYHTAAADRQPGAGPSTTSVRPTSSTSHNEFARSASCPQPSHQATASAEGQARPANKFWLVPHAVTHHFAGRDHDLRKMKTALLDGTQGRSGQRRFLLYGLGGAGKTTLAIKFAHLYREYFHGVFTVDMSSPETASNYWKRIAKAGCRDINEEAGKGWLASFSSWLLILDASDSQYILSEDCFPASERGCVIITSRNPRSRCKNIVGSIQVGALKTDEAADMLRSISQHKPWDEAAQKRAAEITKALDNLPLGLMSAGMAISQGLCHLEDYLTLFKSLVLVAGSCAPGSPATSDDEPPRKYDRLFATFAITVSMLEAQADGKASRQAWRCRDAVELLYTICFFHDKDICLTALATRQRQQSTFTDSQPAEQPAESYLSRFISRIVPGSPSSNTLASAALPAVLLPGDDQCVDLVRLRLAIQKLIDMSLLCWDIQTESYSMHRIVSLLVRSRMSLAKRALWCQAASNTLTLSIRPLPLAEGSEDQMFYLRLLPHVDHVQRMSEEINQQFQRHRIAAQYSTWRSWFPQSLWGSTSDSFRISHLDPDSALRSSRIYFEAGQYDKAAAIQQHVVDEMTLARHDGKAHSFQAQIALGSSLQHQGRVTEASQVLENVRRECKRQKTTLWSSQKHALSCALSKTYMYAGRLKDAKQILEETISAAERQGTMSVDQLQTLGHLSRFHALCLDHSTAQRLYDRGLEQLAVTLDSRHHLVSYYKTWLAMTLCHKHATDANIERAHSLMNGVFEVQDSIFGKQDSAIVASTKARLALTMACLSHRNLGPSMQDAKRMLQEAASQLERELGQDHLQTISAHRSLAYVMLLEGGEVAEDGEVALLDIMERLMHLAQSNSWYRLDRLESMRMIIDYYERKERLDEALAICDAMTRELDSLGDQVEILQQKAEAKRRELLRKQAATQQP